MQKPVKLFFPQEKIMYFLCVSKWKQRLSKEKKIQIVFPDLFLKGEKNTMFWSKIPFSKDFLIIFSPIIFQNIFKKFKKWKKWWRNLFFHVGNWKQNKKKM